MSDIYRNTALYYGFPYLLRGGMCHEAGGTEASSIFKQMQNRLFFYEHSVYVYALVESHVPSTERGSKTV